jgi:hypothetical protein
MNTEGERMNSDSTAHEPGPEAGQAAMWLILTMAFLLVALGTTAYSRLVSATDEVSSLQTAADAAALAGAQAIARDAPQAIKDAVRNGGGIPCGLGRSEAQAFAARNGANVTGYCYYPVQDRIEVTVRSQAVLESGRQESTSAIAELDLRLGPCVLPDAPEPPEPTPTPTPTPSSTATPTPTPTPTPDDVVKKGRCGEVEFDVTFPGGGGPPSFGWGALKIEADPRLTD